MCTRAGSGIWRIITLEQKILEDAQEIKEYTAHPLAFDDDWCDYGVDYSWTRAYPPRGFWHWYPLPLWRVQFDGMTEKETVVLEAADYEEAVGTARWLYPDASNLSVMETEKHFPQ